MNLRNHKLISVILVVVIFASTFLFSSFKYDNNNQTILNHHPSLENIIEEEFINQNENLQLFKWNKNIMLSLNMKYILFIIFIYNDLFKFRNLDFINKLFKFCKYSVFIVIFSNKKDGKKEKHVYSYSYS